MKRALFALALSVLGSSVGIAHAQDTYYFRNAPTVEQYDAILFGDRPSERNETRLRTRGVRGIQMKSEQVSAETSGSPAVEPPAANRIAIPIRFALDSDAISAEFEPHLDNLAAALSTRAVGRSLTITGHTDSTGDAAYNRELSMRRAVAVRAYLIGRGVDPSRIGVSAAGEERPLAGLSGEDGRNRRVEFAANT